MSDIDYLVRDSLVKHINLNYIVGNSFYSFPKIKMLDRV